MACAAVPLGKLLLLLGEKIERQLRWAVKSFNPLGDKHLISPHSTPAVGSQIY